MKLVITFVGLRNVSYGDKRFSVQTTTLLNKVVNYEGMCMGCNSFVVTDAYCL